MPAFLPSYLLLLRGIKISSLMRRGKEISPDAPLSVRMKNPRSERD
jgi:hypothetical protein